MLKVPLEKVYWCSYFNRYICSNCTADDYSIIPGFVLKYWNFKKFTISKEAKLILEKWFDKPAIYIQKKDIILKISSLFRQAVLIKRKIHKIYDLMKCDNPDVFAMNTLGK